MLIFNPYVQYLITNLGILVLYILGLSNLYAPKMLFCVYYISILAFFFILSVKYLKSHKIYLQSLDAIFEVKSKSTYNKIILITFIIGCLANIYQIAIYGMPLTMENKVDRLGGAHYVQYLVNFLLVTISMSYIGIKIKTMKKIWILKIILAISILMLGVWLNRGAFTLFFLTYLFYQYILSVKKIKTKKFWFKFMVGCLVFLMFFGYVGDLRVQYVMENVFQHTINEHYGMSENFPTEFVWIYIYLTNGMENISLILEDQWPREYTFGMRMIYPFIAPFFKEMSFDNNLYPPLDAEAGLNVSTYLIDAFRDFGYLGPYIYMVYLILILRLGQISMKNGVYGFLCYISSVNIALWMIFSNAFAIGSFILIYLFFLVMSWKNKIRI